MTIQEPLQEPRPPNRGRQAKTGRHPHVSISARELASGAAVYRARWREAGTQKVMTFTSSTAAERFADDVERYGSGTARNLDDARARTTAATPIPTVEEWLREHVARIDDLSKGTRRSYYRAIEMEIGPVLGGYPIDSLTEQAIRDWLVWLRDERHLCPATIAKRKGLLSGAFKRAMGERPPLASDNPAARVRIGKGTYVKRSKVFVEPDEFAVLLPLVRPHWRPLVTLLFATGLRFGEATALRVQDLHLDGAVPYLTVSRSWKYTCGQGGEVGPPKTERGNREIGLPAELVETLRPLVVGKARDELVLTTVEGRRIQQGSFHHAVWRGVQDRFEAATGKRPRVHDLRHSHASFMIQSGMNLATVQYRLGHESIKTTVDIYHHLAHNAQGLAAQAASESLRAAFPVALSAPLEIESAAGSDAEYQAWRAERAAGRPAVE